MDSNAINTSRNEVVDSLRAIGLFCVVLAHVNPPNLLFQWRTFDVPLMIIISGISFSISCADKQINQREYFIDRFKRLIFPTWLFFLIYFLSIYLATIISGKPFPWDVREVLSAFMLTDGFAYVWIVRVFLIIAIIAPIISRIQRIFRPNHFLYLLSIIYFIQEGAFKFLEQRLEYFTSSDIYDTVNAFYLCVHQGFTFSVIFSLGLCLPKLDETYRQRFTVLVCILCLGYMIAALIHNLPLSPQLYKYPPRFIFVIYSLSMSLLLYELLIKIRSFDLCCHVLKSKLIYFISQSVLWIYLWHIFFLTVASRISPIDRNFTLKYTFVVILSIATTFIQKTLATIIILKYGIKHNDKNVWVYALLK